MSTQQKFSARLRHIGRWLVQFVAGIIMVLALLVGLARLLLPEAASFKEDIRRGVEQATGFRVDFELISAGLSLYGPELRFSGTVVRWPDDVEAIRVAEVAVSLDVPELLTSGKLVPGHILIRGTAVDIRLAPDGSLLLQGRTLSEYIKTDEQGSPENWPELGLQLTDVAFSFQNQRRNGPLVDGVVHTLDAQLDDLRIEISAELDPGIRYGRTLAIEAELPVALLLATEDMDKDAEWDLQVFARDIRLDKWLAIAELRDLPVLDSEGNAELRFVFNGMRPVAIEAELELEQLQLAQPGAEPVVITRLEGELEWRLASGGWLANGKRVRIGRGPRVWPVSEFMLRYAAGPEPERQRFLASTSFIRLEDLLPFAKALAPGQLSAAGFSGAVAGDLTELSLELLLLDKQMQSFELDAAFSDLGYLSADSGIDVSGISGRITADEGGGNLEIQTRDAHFGVSQLFRDVLDISLLDGLAIWRAGPAGYRVLADGIRLKTPDGSATAALELTLDPQFKNPVIDLTAEASLDKVTAAPKYLPTILSPKLLEWLAGALAGGRVPFADIKLQGPLGKFPFDQGEGVFVIGVNFVDGMLAYAPGWPALENASGRLVFDGASLYSRENRVTTSGIELQNIDMRMDDMRSGVMEFQGAAQVRVDALLGFLKQSPVGAALGPVFADVQGKGDADVSLQLTLPVKDLDQWRLEGRMDTAGTEAGLAGIEQRFTAVTGSARISNTLVSAENITAVFLGEPVTINVEPLASPVSVYSHRAMLNTQLPVRKIQEALKIPVTELLDGAVAIQVQAMFPGGGRDGEFGLFLRSDIAGMTSRLPYPLNKTAEDTDGLQLELRFPERGSTHIYGSLRRGLSWALEARNDDQNWRLARGAIYRGMEIPVLPTSEGLNILGPIDSLYLDQWTALAAAPAGDNPEQADRDPANGWQRMFNRANLQLGELYALGYRFEDVDVDVQFGESAWDIRLDGPWTAGHVTVPYEFTGAAPAVLAMERLYLIEPQASDVADDAQIDPRTLPAVRGQVADFALGNLRLGRLDADVRQVSDGLKSERLHTESASFTTDISYDWRVVDNAQRSRLHLELQSNDVETTLLRLGYAPLLSAKSGAVSADLLWEGGPGMDIVYASTGTIDLTIRNGLVKEVDPGGGRILGLLNVTSLPRRLSLDFKDMSDEGLGFDKITGRFRIDFGDAWTCNLGLEGVVADMGIVGRTGLLAEDYDQVAAVRPHVSNLAPVASAFLAGPGVGFATLLVTQILKKPLSSIGESYYTVLGSWDEPLFTKVDGEDLDATAFAGCEAQLPALSPEEILAIEDLLAHPHVAPEPDSLPPPVVNDAAPQAEPITPGSTAQ